MTTAAGRRLVLVVPCYNEAGRLDADAFAGFVRSRSDTTLLFVDDGSTDATPDILAGLAAREGERVGVLTLARNGGKSRAVHRGMEEALARGPELVGYWDCDLSTPFSALPEFLALLDGDPRLDIVIGSRVKLLGREIRRSELRHYVGRVFATAASLALGLPVYDTQCGAKVFRATRAVRAAFASPFRSAWVFDVEILARYVAIVGRAEAASRIVELPLKTWIEKPGSKVRVAHGFRAAWDLSRIRAWARRATHA